MRVQFLKDKKFEDVRHEPADADKRYRTFDKGEVYTLDSVLGSQVIRAHIAIELKKDDKPKTMAQLNAIMTNFKREGKSITKKEERNIQKMKEQAAQKIKGKGTRNEREVILE